MVFVALLIYVSMTMFGVSQVEHDNVAFDTSPDGRKIAFSAVDGDLYLFDLVSLKVTPLAKTPLIEFHPAYSPDGKTLIFSAHDESGKWSSIYSIDLKSLRTTRLTAGQTGYDFEPGFSSDGLKITFVRAHRNRPYSMGGWTWDDYDIYVMKANGTNQTRLTNQKYYGAGSPGFVDGDKMVAYSADVNRAAGDLSTTLYEVNTSGTAPPRQVIIPNVGVKSAALCSHPYVSKDRRKIVFISDLKKPYDYDVAIANRNGTSISLLNITRVGHYNDCPVFAHDGRSTYFLGGSETNAGSRAIYSLYQVGVDGRNLRKIADSGLFTDPLKWRPKR
jgi:Tol biopolymer transport system component